MLGAAVSFKPINKGSQRNTCFHDPRLENTASGKRRPKKSKVNKLKVNTTSTFGNFKKVI